MRPGDPLRPASQLRLERLLHLSTCTLGRLYVDGMAECYTREPPVRTDRAFLSGESALPIGWYNVSLQPSRRFGQVVPLLTSSPLRHVGGLRLSVGMRILPGRGLHDTDFGLLLGQRLAGENEPRDVHETAAAYAALFPRLELARSQLLAIDLEIC